MAAPFFILLYYIIVYISHNLCHLILSIITDQLNYFVLNTNVASRLTKCRYCNDFITFFAITSSILIYFVTKLYAFIFKVIWLLCANCIRKVTFNFSIIHTAGVYLPVLNRNTTYYQIGYTCVLACVCLCVYVESSPTSSFPH